MGLSASDIVPALDIRSFHFSYGSTPVLRDISLTVMKGDWVAIVGPNGAGKSTLLKCLNRTLPGRHEGISLQGKALGEYSQKTLAREIAYVPQASHVMPGFSALEFVRMARYPHLGPLGWTDRWDERAAYRALEKTGSLALSARPLETLSGGEYQRVMIAGALAQGAGILLLDEPTAFLDPKCRAEVHRLMTELHDEGFTLLWVTHDLCSALRYGHKILGLRDGRVAYYGSTRVFLENGMPESLFDVPFQVVTDPSTDRPLVIQEVLP